MLSAATHGGPKGLLPQKVMPTTSCTSPRSKRACRTEIAPTSSTSAAASVSRKTRRPAVAHIRRSTCLFVTRVCKSFATPKLHRYKRGQSVACAEIWPVCHNLPNDSLNVTKLTHSHAMKPTPVSIGSEMTQSPPQAKDRFSSPGRPQMPMTCRRTDMMVKTLYKAAL